MTRLRWTAGQEFGLLVLRATELIAPFAYTLVVVEYAIHRSDAAKVFVFVEQLGVNLPRRLVGKAFTVELVEYRLSLRFGERPRRSRPRTGCPLRLLTTVKRCRRNVEATTGSRGTDAFAEIFGSF